MTRSKSNKKYFFSLLLKAYWEIDTEVNSQSTVSGEISEKNKQQATFKVAVNNLDKLTALMSSSRWLFIHFK